MRQIVSPLDGLASPFGATRDTGLRFLFAGGEEGAWYDPSDISTLWTDTGGTTAAGDGDEAARIDDKSGNGNNATQATAGLRMTLLRGGQYEYLSGNGSDDTYSVTLPDLGTDATVAYCDETGVTILGAQTISGAYSLPLVNQLYGFVVLDRAMTAAEQSRVTTNLNRKKPGLLELEDGSLLLLEGDAAGDHETYLMVA
jgi:hypothetical protein